MSLNKKIENDKVPDFENMTAKTSVAGPLSLNVACHFKGTKARCITCPRCLDSVEQSHMVFWTKLPIPSNGCFISNTVIPDTFLCLYFHTDKVAPMATSVCKLYFIILKCCFLVTDTWKDLVRFFNEINSLLKAKVAHWIYNQFCLYGIFYFHSFILGTFMQ